jgi:hypothetical protein
MQQPLPDGEYFVDVPRNSYIAPADTWDQLSVNQLIEVKNNLTDKFFSFQSNPAVAKPLAAAIQRVDALISLRLQSS